MVAFTYRMPAGIPGAVTRSSAATIEARPLDPTNYPTTFGVAVAIDATTLALRSITTGDVAEAVYGIYVRPFPTTGNGTDGPRLLQGVLAELAQGVAGRLGVLAVDGRELNAGHQDFGS